MIQHYKTVIEPLNDELGKQLNIKKINVTYIPTSTVSLGWGNEFECDHEYTRTDAEEVYASYGFGGDTSYYRQVEICEDCGLDVSEL